MTELIGGVAYSEELDSPKNKNRWREVLKESMERHSVALKLLAGNDCDEETAN